MQKLGTKKIIKGEASFFLLPGESLENGIEHVHVLSDDEALLLQATESFKDTLANKDRNAGDKWMVNGPIEYIPELSVTSILRLRLRRNKNSLPRVTSTGCIKCSKRIWL